jgi:hypothetical protein
VKLKTRRTTAGYISPELIVAREQLEAETDAIPRRTKEVIEAE